MTGNLIGAVSATVAACSMLVALVGLVAGQWRSSKKDTSELSATLTKIESVVDYIKESIDEMKNNQAKLEDRLGKLEGRVAHIEERAEVPIRRLDRLESKLGVLD